MTCTKIEIPGGGVAIVCTRGRRKGKPKKCATCERIGADLECDGCDKILCSGCSVSPSTNVDFCPACARATFVSWLQAGRLGKLPQAPTEKYARRAAFRKFAREFPEFFDHLRKGSP